MVVRLIDKPVRRLRARALVHALCDLAGCRHNGNALALWWRQHHRVFDVQLNRKWPSYFKGVTPREDLRKQIYLDFPQLKALFDNPLWFALSIDSEERQDWDRLAESIRVGDQPLDAFNGRASLLLFSRVDWSCLGLMIILLRTRSLRFQLHRRWLRRNFTTIFGLACLQTPLTEICLELFGLMNNLLIHLSFDREPFNNWPADSDGFFRLLDFLCLAESGFASFNWVPTCERQALLLWLVLGIKNALCFHFAEVHSSKRAPSLKQLWDRQYLRWCRSPLALGDYQVRLPI